ncbi:MAG: hypothetical protein JWN48_6121 [Myxococcaceae bacterium]|nr:hypothetical protein [Myxococcaceae bacterium]
MARRSRLSGSAQARALWLLWSASLSAVAWASPPAARALDDELDEAAQDSAQQGAAEEPREQERLDDEQALQEERTPREEYRETTSPYEDPDKTYLFVGGAYRFARIPSWLLGAYGVEQGPGVGMPVSFSGELAWRRRGSQIVGALNYTKLNFHGPFQLKGDPIEDTEWMQAKFKLLNLTVAFTRSTSFTDWFQLEYGVEAGLGFLFGDLVRSEAYKRADGTWGKCQAWASQVSNPNDKILFNPAFPNPTPEQRHYCDVPVGDPKLPPPASNSSTMKGAQYGVTARHGLFHGGVPHVIPILGPRVSLRFKPIHQVVLRVDLPLPVIPFGFMGGISAQYGL